MAQVLHTGVVERFAQQELEASPAWVALHADRLYEEDRIPAKVVSPYGVVRVVQLRDGNMVFPGRPQYIGKMAAKLTVESIRKYPLGEASVFDFNANFDALFNALTGVCGIEVLLEGTKIGEIWETSYLETVKKSVTEGNFTTYHHGLSVRVVYR